MQLFGEPRAKTEGCQKCGMFGCDCARPATAPSPLVDLCPACKRARMRCICASHVFHIPTRGADEEPADPAPLRPSERVEATVRHVMRCYYDSRDPAEIERVVRELATKVYIA